MVKITSVSSHQVFLLRCGGSVEPILQTLRITYDTCSQGRSLPILNRDSAPHNENPVAEALSLPNVTDGNQIIGVS